MGESSGPGRKRELTQQSVLRALRKSDKPGLTHKMIADRTGTKRNTVYRRLVKEGAADEWGLNSETYGQSTVYWTDDPPLVKAGEKLTLEDALDDYGVNVWRFLFSLTALAGILTYLSSGTASLLIGSLVTLALLAISLNLLLHTHNIKSDSGKELFGVAPREKR